MTNLLKNLLFALGFAAILFLGYKVFFSASDDEIVRAPGQGQLQTQEFLIRLQNIRNIKIDNSLFSDVRFASLVDFRQEIIDVPAGRENPFAPVE